MADVSLSSQMTAKPLHYLGLVLRKFNGDPVDEAQRIINFVKDFRCTFGGRGSLHLKP